MRTPDDAFYERFNAIINQNGYTIAEAAEVCGVSKSAIYTWSHGTCMPNAYQLAYVCYALGVSADWIIGLSEEVERR